MDQAAQNVYWDDVEIKQDLPEKNRKIDTTTIAMGATWATHDFMPVHHDRDFAQSKGAPDVFMNILTSNGLISTYLEQWAGPGARIKEISIKLSVPNFPNDNMAMNARITRKWEEGGEHLIELGFAGDNQMGPHAAGTAIMSLPKKG
ncbi:MAG: acyl dehydratase [Halieaceae bacterium]|jgi:hypothetical protein|nr:acyl dehydratase [Halieaceae bacterium]